MSGDLPLTRPYEASRMPAALRRPTSQPLARKSLVAFFFFVLLVVLCLFDLNTVAYNAWGVFQAFSSVILVACVILLLMHRLTVYRDLGPSGRAYFLFVVAFIVIGTPIGLSGDPQGIIGRWYLIRMVLASVLVIFAASVAARATMLAFGTKFTLRLLFALGFLIPLAIWASSYYPEFYRVQLGESRDHSRATGTFNNPNEAGSAVCMFVALAFGYMMTDRSKLITTILAMTGLVVAAFAIMLTASRGAFVIFTFVIAAQAVISPGFKKFLLIFAGGAVISVMVYAVYNMSMLGDDAGRGQIRRMETLGRVLTGDVSDETTGGRFQLAMNGINEWLKSPLIGNGIGSQRRVGAANIGPHNTYILIAGEAGVIPLALYLGMIATMFWQAWRCHVPAIKTLAMSFAIVVTMASMTGHGLINSREHAVMMGITFGLLAACLELKAAEKRGAVRRPRPALPVRAVPAIR